MRVLWICGLPNEVRLHGDRDLLSPVKTAAWSWILGHFPPPNDVELHILCPVLGLEVACREFFWEGVHWHCFRQKRFELVLFWTRFYFSVKAFVKKLNPDVIHGWGGETGCGWVATLLSNRAVVSVQGLLRLFWSMLESNHIKTHKTIASILQEYMENAAYHRARKLLVESEISNRELIKFYGAKGIVVPHPLRKQFLVDSGMADVGSMMKDVKLLFVGSLCSRKGACDVIRAFCACKSKNIHLTIVGEGPLRAEMQNLIGTFGAEKKVDLIGGCDAGRVAEFMKRSDVFVLPTYGDTGPTVLKEALAVGLYPICYDNTGPHELITKYCGSLIETGNVEAFSVCIDKVAIEILRYKEIAARCSATVRCDLSAQSAWRKLLEIYRA